MNTDCPAARLAALLLLGWGLVAGIGGCGGTTALQDGHGHAYRGQQHGDASHGFRQTIQVVNSAQMLAALPLDDTEVVLAATSEDPGGIYVIPPCPPGVVEASDPTCGEVRQGDNSVLRSDLVMEIDANGTAVSATGGALVDCSGLPGSGLALSCIVAGANSTIRNLTVRNGLQTPDPDQPNGYANNRNAITIVAGKPATVEEVYVLNARRGVFLAGEDGMTTSGQVYRSIIEGTELAGVFVWARKLNGAGTDDATFDAEVEGNRLTHIGRFPLLLVWAYTGSRNDSHVEFIDNVVDETNIYGIQIQGLGQGTAQDNTVSFEADGNLLQGDVGLYVTEAGSPGDNSRNAVYGEVRDLTVENSTPAIWLRAIDQFGTGNTVDLEIRDSSYVSDDGSPGEVRYEPGAGTTIRIDGSAADFEANNDNFDISGALGAF